MDDYPTSNARNIERIYMMRDGGKFVHGSEKLSP